MKFGRTYKLAIFSNADSSVPDLTIDYPITLKFQLANNCLQSANQGHFVIYNLGEQTRAAIYRDIFDIGSSYRGLVFAAGYESEPDMPIVFKGDIQWAYSYRQGPDWITEISAYDGGVAMQKCHVDMTVPAGYDLQNLLKQIVLTMKSRGVEVGAIGTFESNNSRGRTVSGNTWEQLVKMMAPYDVRPFINKGVVHIVNQNEYISDAGGLTEISSETGLIGTPRRQDAILKATMIFEPRVEVGQILRLKSDEPSIQIALGKYGDHKVMDVSHTGVISGAVGGDALTTVTFYLAPGLVPV